MGACATPKTCGFKLFGTALTAVPEEVAEQVPSLTTTEYVPDVLAVIDAVVAPVFHEYE
jgi:hypothetical protein